MRKLRLFVVAGILLCAAVAFCPAASAAMTTVGTFQDPTIGQGNPSLFFTIDLNTDTISAGWDDSKTGLNLSILGQAPLCQCLVPHG